MILSLFIKWIVYFLLFTSLSCSKNTGYKYVYNYETNLNLKNITINKEIINFKGKVELTPYVLQDDSELLIVELKLTNSKLTIKGVTIRENGLTDRIFIKQDVTSNEKNLLSGLVNILNVNKLKTNGVEEDTVGECNVTYTKISAHTLRKIKTNCQPNHHEAHSDNEDSFSVFNKNDIYTDYVYDESGILVTVASYETRVLESILFNEFKYQFLSTTTITYDKKTTVEGIKDNIEREKVIHNELGRNITKIALYTYLNFDDSLYLNDDSKFVYDVTESLKSSDKKSNLIQLVKLFRQVHWRKTFDALLKSPIYEENSQLMHDAFIHCGSVICLEYAMNIINKIEEEKEILRMILVIQHTRKPIPHFINMLWPYIQEKTGNIYNQGIQTISSIIQASADQSHTQKNIKVIIKDIKNNFNKCTTDVCQLVHISAMKNSRHPIFYDDFQQILMKTESYANSVLAAVYNSVSYLKYTKTQRDKVKKSLYKLVKTNINSYKDTLIQYYAINSLILLNVETSKIVAILNELNINDIDFYYFLVKKLKELIELDVIDSPDLLVQSKLFKKNPLLYHTYQDHKGSKVLMAPLFDSNSSLVDIHFNILANSKTGVIKHSLTDIYLGKNTFRIHLFSLNSHMKGLDYFTNSNSNDEKSNDNIEGLVQLSLFGKETSPVKLFDGLTELTSAVWSAPTELTSILNGNFLQIDSQKIVRFQNGLLILCNHMGNLELDISFQLESSFYYRTGNALVRATTRLNSIFEYSLNTIDSNIKSNKEVSLSTGIDIRTELDFYSNPTRSCFSLKQLDSRYAISAKKSLKLPGYTFSLSKNINRQCSEFQDSE